MANFIVDDIKKIFATKNYLLAIIIVNIVVFIVQNLIIAFSGGASGSGEKFLLEWFALPANILKSITHIWTYFSYMFMHGGLLHIVFNMLYLYWFGRIFADIYSHERLLRLHIVGGLFSGLYFVVMAFLFQIAGSSFIPDAIPLIGASGAVMAVIAAVGTLLPHYEMRLILFGYVKLKWVALAAFILTTVLNFNMNTGGKLAHLGGAIFGYLYAINLKKGTDITQPLAQVYRKVSSLFTGKKSMRVVYSKKDTKEAPSYSSNMSKRDIQRKTDEILDKINKSGYNSLTREEKDFLTKASKQ